MILPALVIALLGLLALPATIAAEKPRPCLIATLGEQQAAFIRQLYIPVEVGDQIIARHCVEHRLSKGD